MEVVVIVICVDNFIILLNTGIFHIYEAIQIMMGYYDGVMLCFV
jgi:hypothetical protein